MEWGIGSRSPGKMMLVNILYKLATGSIIPMGLENSFGVMGIIIH
jgi:hypothetical protein